MTNDITRYFESHYKKMVRFDAFMGLNLTVVEPGEVRYTLPIKEDYSTAPESAHGGVCAAMMDATLGVAALSYAVTKGNLCATVEFKINYIAQVRPGETLSSHGKIKHVGSRLIVSEAKIKEATTGELKALGLGTFTQYPIEKRAEEVQ